MINKRVFDLEHAQLLSERRVNFLNHLLQDLKANTELRTALDAGCGLGYFSKHLSGSGMKVTAFDIREENVFEARRRCGDVTFFTMDVEDPRVQGLGQFDLVLCFGLLYHLENPFRAIRNLYTLTRKALVIESMVASCPLPGAILVSEDPGEDQSSRYIAFVCSEGCIIKMLYAAGFPKVYRARILPDHNDFRETYSHKRRRTVLIASKIDLQSPMLQMVPESRERPDLWRKKWVSLVLYVVHLTNGLRRKAWANRI